MKKYTKLLILLLALVMLVQSTAIGAFAITFVDVDTGAYKAVTGTGYTKASDVVYKKSGQYVYNWGAREEDATFLSTYALSFYSSNYDYDTLSSKNGGSSQSTAPSSALYAALKSLMSSKQTYETSYKATRPLFQYTDCQMNGNKISSFYSGELIGPSWDGGSTWNREHTWPDSKGDASGNGENDIMMLRPTSVSENSSRGNKAYGPTTTNQYYNPNQESNGQYDLRGDVARICLYVYVRWGNTGSMWGASGVIQSLDVLLLWMEEDPVDTWEMGRNDAVQSITGTRNVFVDYPEYAWLLFGEEIPDDMVTPSGEAMEDSSTGGGTTTPPSTGGDGGEDDPTTPPSTGGDSGEDDPTTPPSTGGDGNEDTPSTPQHTASDFKSAVSHISSGDLMGEQLYKAIRDTIKIYASLSDSDKSSVADEYKTLVDYAEKYNQSVDSYNEEVTSTVSIVLNAIVITTVSTFGIGVCALLSKKYF